MKKKDMMNSLMKAFQQLLGEIIDFKEIDSEEVAELSIHGENFCFPIKTLEAMEDYLGHEIDRMGLS
mgnify:CR=1 FL=1|tara:strand:+ start:2036 stop:2236 length:201 start_codon:yes stop_codon:yes gene_type:complete